MSRRKVVIAAVVILSTISGYLIYDSIATRQQNADDLLHLAQVKLGMTEADTVKIVKREPLPHPIDKRRQCIYLWQRSSLIWSLLHPNNPTVGRTITIENGKVTDIREDVILR